MRIGIEAQRIFRFKKHGMDMVAVELIRNLQEIDKVNEYCVFVKKDVDPCISETANFRIIELPSAPYPIWEQFILPRAARREKCDILHCTSNTAPLFSKVPVMVTLHDIIYMESLSLLKKGFTLYQKFGNLYRRMVVPSVVERSKSIITVSEFEKVRIGTFFNIQGSKLKAVYNGVGIHFKKITGTETLKRIKEKYKLPDRFIFFLGNTDPKKNVRNTLAGFSMFYKYSENKMPLVMLDYDHNELVKIATELNDPDLVNHIILTGYVPNTELPAIYSQALIMLYPSLRESFGIPVLEAMACGVPVITSNTSSLPEVAGDAAILVNPNKPEEIAGAISRLIENSALCSELVEKGYKQSAKFSWKAMASRVFEIYKEVVPDNAK